jgi:hypothetical protein
MRLRATYGVDLEGHFPTDQLPLSLALDGPRAEIVEDADSERRLNLVVEVPVDPAGLRLERTTGIQQDGQELPAVVVAELGETGIIARRIVDALSFITRCPTALFGKSGDEPFQLVPDDDGDAEMLEQFGTRLVYAPPQATSSVWLPLRLAAQNVEKLYRERESGIRLYADALKMGTSAGRLREFWRVLEAAFGVKDDDLIDLVSRCEVATDMELTRDDLRGLHTLRGRASHASTRAGMTMRELAAVEREAGEAVGRLQGLVEALIVRKADWGVRTVAVDANAPLYPYTRRDGTIVLHTLGTQASGR